VILPVLNIPQANVHHIIFVASARASHHAFGQAELTRSACVFAIVATHPYTPHTLLKIVDLVFFEKKIEFFGRFCFSNFSKNGSEKFEKFEKKLLNL
jgi:hypothetical protein